MTLPADDAPTGFHVHLPVFDGPFDLLLALIGKHKLDVTEVALAQVTDEFLVHIRMLGEQWDLGQTTEFLVVAATLLDLKVARLLPQPVVEEEEDLALLEAKDLLFARLLQYKAYKQAAALLAALFAAEARWVPREVGLEARWAAVLPPAQLGVDTAAFAVVGARVLAPREDTLVAVDHIHAPRVDVGKQMQFLLERLLREPVTTFRALTRDCVTFAEVVGRFLAVLELYRDGHVAFDQVEALGDLHVRSTPSFAGAAR